MERIAGQNNKRKQGARLNPLEIKVTGWKPIGPSMFGSPGLLDWDFKTVAPRS